MPTSTQKPDFKLGADPEFGFVRANGTDIASASEVIDYADDDGQFGVDGGGEVAEIRPTPSEDPTEVVGNIRKAMQRGIINSPNSLRYQWKAGSMAGGRPVGGHLHFGTLDLQNRRVNVRTLVSMLDIYLAQIVILLEDPDEARGRRCDSEYGHLGGYRDQPWGFEYRTLGSWLTSPYVATGILALGKAVVHETLFNGLADDGKTHIRPDVNQFNQATMEELRKRFRPLWADISKFELYKKYSKYIGLVRTLVAGKLTWFPKCGMRDAWGLVDAKPGKAVDMPHMTLNKVWDGFVADTINPETLSEEQLT
jgi:hypothetical protein